MNTKHINRIFKYLVGLVALIFIVFRFEDFMDGISSIISVLSPFLIGGIIALYGNVLLNSFERLLNRLSFFRNLKSGIKRGLSLLITIVFLIGIFIFAFSIVIPSIRETLLLVSFNIPRAIQELEVALSKYDFHIPDEWIDSINKVVLNLPSIIRNNIDQLLLGSISVITSTISFVVNVFLALVFSLYVLTSKNKVSRQLKRVLKAFLPAEAAEVLILSGQRFVSIFNNFTVGTIKEALIFVLLNTILMKILDLPYIFTVGVIVFFLAFIPYFGAFFGGLIGSLLVATSGLKNGIIYLVIYVILQQIEGNVINPRVVGGEVGLPGIWVMASVTIFGAVFGILGMLLAVPITAIIYFSLRDVVNFRLRVKDGEDKLLLSQVIRDELED